MAILRIGSVGRTNRMTNYRHPNRNLSGQPSERKRAADPAKEAQ